jgi:pantoate--beta-alanine ligase
MSSRNRRLSPEQRKQATVLHRMLKAAEDAVRGDERNAKMIQEKMNRVLNEAPLAELDYAELADPDSLQPKETVDGPTLIALAVRFGEVRLIDNAVISPKGID